MADDIDIGISVHAQPGDIATVQAAAAAVKEFTLSAQQGSAILASVGNDYAKFVVEVRKLKEAHDAAQASAAEVAAATTAQAAATQQATTATMAQAAATQKATAATQAGVPAQAAATQATQQATIALRGVVPAQTAAAAATSQAANAAVVATGKVRLFGSTADASFQTVPRGARTAANALQTLSIAATTGAGSMTGMVRATGNLAFGLSQLSGSANVVAGAAGIGAIITVIGIAIELFEVFANREEKVNKGLGDLSKNIGGLNFDQLRGALEATDRTLDQLTTKRNALDQQLGKAIGSPIGLPSLISTELEIGRVDDRIKALFEQRNKLAAAAADIQTAAEKEVTDVTIKANEAALQSFLKRTQGETAARRQQVAFEEQQAIGAIRISGDTETKKSAAITAIRKQAAADLSKLDDAEQDRITKARADNEVRVAKILETTQIAASKEANDNAEALNAQSRAQRLISEREFIKTRETLELEEIGREEFARLASIDTQIAAQKTLLEQATEPEKRVAVQGVITGLQDQRNAVIAGAKQQSAVVSAQALKDTADLARKLAEAIQEATAHTLEAQGHLVEAATITLHKQFDDLIREAEKAGDAVGAAALRAQLALGVQQSAVRELDQTASRAEASAQNQIARVNALLSVHAITTSEARKQIVDALEGERAAIEKVIAGLQAEAALAPGGDPETLAKIDAFKTKLGELNAEIEKTSDSLFALKEAGRDATTTALAGFLEGLTKLGGQDRSQINGLTGQLKSAQKELNELLAIPAQQRSGETNKRISDLRAEIEATSVSLDNAKSSITTWRDLFVSALQSIADALVKVSSQMLATAIIERLLGIAGGGGDPADAIIAQGIPGVQVIGGHAGGGPIRGKGTGTSDQNLAWLSNDEYVIRASRVRQFGQAAFDAINFDGEWPVVLPPRIRRYAAGGLVESAGAARFAGGMGGSAIDVFVHDSNDHVVRVVERTMESPRGRDITIKHVRKNPRQLGLD